MPGSLEVGITSHTQASPGGSPGQTEEVCLGTVVGVRGGFVMVELDSNEQCSTCSSKGHCNLAQQGSKQVELAARGFRKGERVRVNAEPGAMLKVSIALYVFPVLLVVAGAFTGYLAFEEFLGLPGDYGSLAGVALGLVLSWLFVHFYRSGQAGGPPSLRLEKVEVDEC